MSLLVKGVEMPTGNDELRLIIHPNGQVVISHKTHYEEAEAVPVPKHGRLIDADALLDDLLFPSKQFERGMRELIGDAPTIIPAEQPKEET